tara:strand:- start:33 stop:470 length:438 start_codon:yes stop_codon:yes gene_type:complete
MTTALGSEQWAVIAVIDPANNGAGETFSTEWDMSLWSRVQAVLQTGSMAGTSTVDFKLQDSATSGGALADITGKAITQLTAAGTDDDKQVVVNLRFDELNEDGRYCMGLLTVANAASNSSAVILGLPRYYPASDNDASTVDEIVN